MVGGDVPQTGMRQTQSYKTNQESLGILYSMGTCSLNILVYKISDTLKGYSGVNLIHGLNHCETVLDSLSRDQVSRPLIYGVLRQHYTALNGSKYKPPAIKATNNAQNSTKLQQQYK